MTKTMIKKSLRAYISRRQLIFFILPHRKVAGLAGFQLVEHQVHGVFELLIVLPDLHAVDHLDEGGEILFLHRGLVVDVADERAVQQRLGLDPEIVPGLALALGVGDEGRYQLQDVLFAMDIAEGVIVHRLLEVDGVQHLDLVRLVDDLAVLVLHRLAVLAQLGRTPLEHLAALHQDGALGAGFVKINYRLVGEKMCCRIESENHPVP